MKHTNIEIKAKCSSHEKVREMLVSCGADFKGTDRQIDTYFTVNNGRLKLREGNLENYLIYYEREDTAGPKQSNVILLQSTPKSSLKSILVHSCGVLVTVDKKREIYFIENVKFHIDIVRNLGTFVEIEAIDIHGDIGKDALLEQCTRYLKILDIPEQDLVAASYSDLLLAQGKT